MNQRFTEKARIALNGALKFARELGHTYVGTEHILLGLLSVEESIGSRILSSRGVDTETVKELIISAVGSGTASDVSGEDMTPMTKKIIEESSVAAARLGHNYIGTEHLLLAIVCEPESFANKILRSQNVSAAEIKNDLSEYFGGVGISGESTASGRGAKEDKEQIPGCPTLSKHGIDLCRRAREGRIDPIIGRDSETERVIQILSRRTKNNPCLIGEPGVGKTAVVEGLAQRIADGNVPENLKNSVIVTLDIPSMVAGAKYRGEFEERMKGVMEEVEKAPHIILFVDEIHTIIGAGGAEGAVDAANIIKPALARGAMQLIGATTIDEYRKHIEKDAALERRFQSVTVGEPTPDEAVQILYGLRDKYEAHHKLKISDEAIEAAVRLSVRYIGDRFLPDKAIDLVDEAASRLRIKGYTPSAEVKELEEQIKSTSAEKEEAILGEDYERAASLRDSIKQLEEQLSEAKKADSSTGSGAVVGSGDIEDIVTSWTGIPVKKLQGEEAERLLRLDSILKERVIGQDEAVDAVARAIRRGRTGLKDPGRPVGSFIFLGPTGVGKTELSKALADVMFGSEEAMIRVDMSEYMEKHSVSKLIGSPPGYVGFDDGGQLTEKIRRHPYSVVLFDEIEKAHPDVFNILLQILDDGILTDAKGRRVDFKNAVIIMTSNVGAGAVTDPKRLGFTADEGSAADEEKMKQAVKDALKATFRPEFLNRVDDIIVFSKLSDGSIEKIAALMLDEVKARIAAQDISVEFDESVVSALAKEGFDPVYGARPLRRAIVRKVEDSFSAAMLSGRVKAGDSVRAAMRDGAIVYE